MTWPILYEFLRVTTHPRVMRKPGRLGRRLGLLYRPCSLRRGLESLSRRIVTRPLLRKFSAEFPWLAGNLLHDAHTAVLMREHGVARICTRDADFRRFAFLEVVEPN